MFEPRPPLALPDVEPLVWAIDAWHAPMYYVPRDCPRACFWPGAQTSADDRERWFGGVDAKMVVAIESAWLDRLRSTTLYRYTMPVERFVASDDTAGHFVSRERVTPLSVEPVGDLLAALAASNVELRITPRLVALWQRVIATTLEFSGTRLRNAEGWREVFGSVRQNEAPRQTGTSPQPLSTTWRGEHSSRRRPSCSRTPAHGCVDADRRRAPARRVRGRGLFVRGLRRSRGGSRARRPGR